MEVPIKRLYKKIILIRYFEELLLNLFSNGEIFGTTHTYVGQEAVAVSLIDQLDVNDIIFSNHRCHGHFLAKENDPEGLLAEIMGKASGVCSGKGGSQHLYKNNFYSNGIQGGILANSLGMAFAEKYLKTNKIVTVFIGDGTLGEGICYEVLNLASLWEVPLLVVIENNFYAQSTHISLNLSGSILKRIEAFEIKCDEIESNDIMDLYPKFNKAINYVREYKKPFVQIVNTYRLNAHSKGDDFRSKDEIEKWEKKDPLALIEKNLDTKIINDEKIKIKSELDNLVNKLRNSDEIAEL